MQVQPLSNQSFGAIKFAPKTDKYIENNLSKVARDHIKDIVAKNAKNPVEGYISHLDKEGKFMAEIGYPFNPTAKIFLSEESYGRKISLHDFIDKVAKITDLIHEKKMDVEDIRLLSSRIK